MIVPMKKLAVIVPGSEEESTVGALRSLGVVHLQHVQAPQGEEASALRDKLNLISSVEGILAEYARPQSSPEAPQEQLGDWQQTARHIVDQHQRLDQLSEYARNLHKQISEWECWGDFDPAATRALTRKNVFIRFYRIPKKALNTIPSDCILHICSVNKSIALCAVISLREQKEFGFKALELPQMSLSQMRERRNEGLEVIGKIRMELTAAHKYRAALAAAKKKVAQDLEYTQAVSGMGRAGALSYITGFIPSDTAARVTQTAQRARWGIAITDPDQEDVVPTLIRNPRWVSLISPVFQLIEVVPGYREFDTSAWFLLFFSLFCGMIIGDAGYGLIFLLLTVLAQRKWGRLLPRSTLFGLIYVASGCAVVWGVLSGTFFGQAWLPDEVKPLIPALRSDATLQRICFLIGAVHLSIAHIWRLINKLPSVSAVAEAGWICILWGAFLLAKMLILNDPLPPFTWWLIGAGAFGVVIFVHPQRNLLKGVGSGLGTFLLSVVNNFTDIVSYIRLFAVGLATVAVADAFNNMALQVGFGSLIAGFGAACIILVGIILNLILTPLSILVHGVRLNILEFSVNHLGITWDGKAYTPFKSS